MSCMVQLSNNKCEIGFMFMGENIKIAIISAGLASLINCIFQLVNILIDIAKDRSENSNKKQAVYIEKKEKVYIAAIGRLLQIRRGFDYTREMVIRSKKIQDNIDSENTAYAEVAPQLRLYSTDKIFNKYYELAAYARFAYAPQDGPRLIRNSIWAYDLQVTLLSRLMQEDLGYRKYNSEHDMIVCPECTCEHDIISKCPNCGLTYNDLQQKMQELLSSMQELGDENSESNS